MSKSLKDKLKFLSVLQQYDYDSSTVRKRISHEALVSITLPFIKKKLAPSYKTVSPKPSPRPKTCTRMQDYQGGTVFLAGSLLTEICHHGNRHNPAQRTVTLPPQV